MLAVFPDSFDEKAASALWEIDEDSANYALGHLTNFSLVDFDATNNRYSLHDLSRDFAAARLREHLDEDYGAHKRHSTYYLAVLASANKLFLQGNDAMLNGLQRFDDERANIEAGQSWTARHSKQNQDAAYLCMYYPDSAAILSLRQSPCDRIIWGECALDSARRFKKRHYESAYLVVLGNAHLILEETQSALKFYEQALPIAREIGDRVVESRILGNLGIVYTRLKDGSRAVGYFDRQLKTASKLGERRDIGSALLGLGNVHMDLDDVPRALDCYNQSLEIMLDLGDIRGEGAVLGALGSAYIGAADLARAHESFNRALAISRIIGDQRGEAHTLFNVSVILDGLGQRAQAIESATSALKIYEQIEAPKAEIVRRQLAEWGGK